MGVDDEPIGRSRNTVKGTLHRLALCPRKLDCILYVIKLEGWAELQAKLAIRASHRYK